jgi:hypothetical protein
LNEKSRPVQTVAAFFIVCRANVKWRTQAFSIGGYSGTVSFRTSLVLDFSPLTKRVFFWWPETSINLLRVALAVCDARCTLVQLRFSTTIAAARDGYSSFF